MDEELKKDIIDGKIIDWSKLSAEELRKLRKQLLEKEEEILRQIDEELEEKDN